MKKKIILTAVSLALLVLSVIFVVMLNSPEYVMIRSVSDAMLDAFGREEAQTLSSLLQNGSVAFSAKDVSGYEALSLSGKLYFSNDAFMLEDLSISDREKRLEADVYLGYDKSYISCNDILGGAYGILPGSSADAFKNSVFSMNREQAVTDELAVNNTLIRLLSFYDNQEEYESIVKDAEKPLKKYVGELWALICEEGELSVEYSVIKTNGVREDVRLITLNIDSGELSRVLSRLFEKIRNDEEVLELIKRMSRLMGEIEYSIGESATLEELYTDIFVNGSKGIVKDLLGELESLQEEYTLSVATPYLSKKLLQLKLSVVGDDTKSTYILDIGKDGIRNTDRISFTVSDTDDDFEMTYKIRENERDRFLTELCINGHDIYLDIDKKEKCYTLDIDTISVNGGFFPKSGELSLTVDEVKARGIVLFEGNIKLLFKKNDKMPEPEMKFENLFEAESSEVERWLEALGAFGLS